MFIPDDDTLLQIKDICRKVVPLGRCAFLAGVARGDFPQPVRLGKKKFWRLSELEKLLRDGAPLRRGRAAVEALAED